MAWSSPSCRFSIAPSPASRIPTGACAGAWPIFWVCYELSHEHPNMKICAVIPAAGRGTRLGGTGPKILTRLSERHTIWSILYEKLSPLVDHIHLVLSPEAGISFPALPAKVS